MSYRMIPKVKEFKLIDYVSINALRPYNTVIGIS